MKHLSTKRKVLAIVLVLALVFIAANVFAEGEEGGDNAFIGTFWSLVPPIVAIVLALITKEVYSSLFAGIVVGAFFVSNGSVIGTLHAVTDGGLVAVLTDSWNVGILIFTILLGVVSALAAWRLFPNHREWISRRACFLLTPLPFGDIQKWMIRAGLGERNTFSYVKTKIFKNHRRLA